jgi:hypothetical protein
LPPIVEFVKHVRLRTRVEDGIDEKTRFMRGKHAEKLLKGRLRGREVKVPVSRHRGKTRDGTRGPASRFPLKPGVTPLIRAALADGLGSLLLLRRSRRSIRAWLAAGGTEDAATAYGLSLGVE